MTEQEHIEQLKKDNQKLQKELDSIKKSSEKKKSVGFWILKKSSTPLIGVKLKKSISNAITEYKLTKTVSVDTVSDVSSNVIWRVTRIGIFAFFMTIVPSLILLFQTKLVMNQNQLVGDQNTLIEADRKSSLVFIMDNVLSDLSEELKYKGSSERNISPVLEARIISLSRAMKPYQYNEKGELTDREISPERGQFLFNLIKSELGDQSRRDILNLADFNYADFKNTSLGRGVDLKYIHLNYSDMQYAEMPAVNMERSELKEANMLGINLSDANLIRSDLTNANLTKAELLSADLTNANLYGVNLTKADLTEATLWGTKLHEAILSDVILDNAIVHRKDWIAYVSDSLDLKGAGSIADRYMIKKQGEKQFILVARK